MSKSIEQQLRAAESEYMRLTRIINSSHNATAKDWELLEQAEKEVARLRELLKKENR